VESRIIHDTIPERRLWNRVCVHAITRKKEDSSNITYGCGIAVLYDTIIDHLFYYLMCILFLFYQSANEEPVNALRCFDTCWNVFIVLPLIFENSFTFSFAV
jgi:hypothetical protein